MVALLQPQIQCGFHSVLSIAIWAKTLSIKNKHQKLRIIIFTRQWNLTMYEKTYPKKRFNITLDFVEKHLPKGTNVLDLGIKNPLSEKMKIQGYHIQNTQGEDLDEDQSILQNASYDALTGFEIFEHLLNPYSVLKEIKCHKILLSVPLKLWFAKAYKSKTDPRDRHYHEFEAWQFQWLLEKTGWEIKDQIKFTHPVKKIGFRPILRWFTPRYYLVYAEKKENP